MEVYKNLPALIIDHITITETDIDSMTNISLLRPTIKINLNLKEKYKKGFFGSIAVGAGSASKYLATGEINTYQKSRQLSLEMGSNNINAASGSFFEPLISFLPDGSRTGVTRMRTTYRDLYLKNRLEINMLISAKDVRRKMESISEQLEGALDQNSRTVNNNKSHSRIIDAANLILAFKIDSLNSLKISVMTEFNKTDNTDSLNYSIYNGNSLIFSSVNKVRNTFYRNMVSDIIYHHRSTVKKGRSTNFSIHQENRSTDVNEEGLVTEVLKQDEQKYAISGMRNGTEKSSSLNWSFIEPLNQDMYIKILSSYRRESLYYMETQLQNIALQQNNGYAVIVNDYAKIGFNIRRTGKK
ncbi:hypothetical protein [Pedobacter sp. P26]|uniref:hypothetical protein n=1 Tax=Pedobacter sp. P26 TaxID=3423956 RepID=UPI003D67C09B